MKNYIFSLLLSLLLCSNFLLAQQHFRNEKFENTNDHEHRQESQNPFLTNPYNSQYNISQQSFNSSRNAIIPDFQVNDIDDSNCGSQFSPSISSDANGNFVTTWCDLRNGDSNIYAQRYSSDGTILGENFKVNDDHGNLSQGSPSISSDDSGYFVITWNDYRNGNIDIYAQRYSSDGTALSTNFKVNDDQGSSNQHNPAISVDSSGDFVITWYDLRNANRDIYAQRYSNDGTALSTNFKVNDDEGSTDQYHPAICIDNGGNFVIAWEDKRNEDKDIYAQRYGNDGSALGENFKVNDDEGSSENTSPSISSDAIGNYIITWEDYRNDNYTSDIYLQRYANDGSALGANFKVNDDYFSQFVGLLNPSISTDNNGNFVISFETEYYSGHNIYAQRYASDGSALSTHFKVNDNLVSSNQRSPSISSDDNGNFVITWQDFRNGDSDIYTQRYAGDGTKLRVNLKVNDDQGSAAQWSPAICVGNSGSFVITWDEERNGGWDVYAQRYTSEGAPLGSNFIVNDDVANNQDYPAICSDGTSNVIITWMDARSGNNDIYAQRYSSDGTPLGSNFKVNDISTSGRLFPAICSDGAGNFVITWKDNRNYGNDVYAQRYGNDGSALGENFKVNDDYNTTEWIMPSISSDNNGNFVITWEVKQYNDEFDIYAQLYTSDGTAVGSNIKINDNTNYTERSLPSISSDTNGNFVVTWQDERNGDSDIFAQLYSREGIALGGNFKVNDDQGYSEQTQPSISIDANGSFIITWDDERNGDKDIFAQCFASDGTPLGENFKVNSDSEKKQYTSHVQLRNNRIYSTWMDNRTEGRGYDIWANVLQWEYENPVSVDENSQLPSEFILFANYPNPFNPSTTIGYNIPPADALSSAEVQVSLKIYDTLGRKVATLFEGKQIAGYHEQTFKAENLTSGIYIYRLVGENVNLVKKMVLLK